VQTLYRHNTLPNCYHYYNCNNNENRQSPVLNYGILERRNHGYVSNAWLCLTMDHDMGGSLRMVLGVHVLDQVDDAVAVSVLVIVPCDKLDEVVVQRDTRACIKNAAE
jgi:hypothetical protein